jgi:O-antigen/teichoic acid export membrane protein
MLRKLLDLLSDTLTYGASSLIGQVINFLLLRLYTEFLDTAQYGVIGMLAIVTLLFGPLANLGMTNAIFRRYAMSKDEATRQTVLGTGLSSIIASSLVLLLVSLLAAEPIARFVVGDVNTVNLVRLSLLSAAIATVGTVPRVMLRASRRVRTVALLNISQILFTTVPTIWFVVVQQQGVRGVVLGTLTGEVLSAVLAFFCTLGSFRAGFNLPTWREMLSYGLPFVPHHLQAVALALFGQYVVREMLGFHEAGLYNVASKFAMPVTFVVTAVQNSWVAYKFQIHAEDDDPKAFFRSTFTYYVAAITYLWVGVSLWGPEMVRLMTTEGFHPAARMVWAVSLIPLAQGIYFMSGTGMELSDNTRPFPLVSLAGLLTVIVGAYALVPQMGAMGAAVATVLGWVVMSGVMYVFARRRFAIEYDWATIACFGLLAAACVTAGCMVQDSPLSLRASCALALSLAYPLAAFMLLLRSPRERHRMQLLLTKFRLAPFSR